MLTTMIPDRIKVDEASEMSDNFNALLTSYLVQVSSVIGITGLMQLITSTLQPLTQILYILTR
mgnify:CR=1 FL=1